MTSDTHSRLVMCSIDMSFSPGKVDQALQLLLSSVGRTEAQSGCKECRVTQDATEKGRIRYSALWDSEPNFRRHVKSQEFRRVLMAMDLGCEEPQVTIGNLTGRRSLDYLQELHKE